MSAFRVWILVVAFGAFLFSGCKGCKQESAQKPSPAAAEPQTQPEPQVDAGTPAAGAAAPEAATPEAVAPQAGMAQEPQKVVKRTQIKMPDVTMEELNDPSFPKALPPQARKSIIRLRKLQQTDPRFKRKATGQPTPPPEDETSIVREARRKKRNQ